MTDGFQKEKQQLPRKRKYIYFILLFVIIVFCGAIYFLWHSLQAPAIGVIHPGTLPKKDEFDQGTETKQFVGKDFSFSYQGKYQEISHTLPEVGSIKETFFLSASDIEGKKIAVVEEERDGSTLDASPSFQMRRNDPKTYKKSTLRWESLDRVLFTKDSQVFEKTLFIQKKNFILSVSVSSPFSGETLSGDLENILNTLEWKTKE